MTLLHRNSAASRFFPNRKLLGGIIPGRDHCKLVFPSPRRSRHACRAWGGARLTLKHYREIYSVVFPLTFCRQQADTDVIELDRFVSIVFEHFAVHFQGRQVHILRLFRHDDSRGESMSSEHDGKDQDDLFSPLPYLLVSGAVVLMTLLLRCLFCPGEQF
ncbi:hypothetical protein IPC1360_11590 [Pseudomonas aeruginosa]|nr:hypothetical protein IPC1360_11590 [Pseudomonas aeruginosa]